MDEENLARRDALAAIKKDAGAESWHVYLTAARTSVARRRTWSRSSMSSTWR